MTNLTEQWGQGTIPTDWYYIKSTAGRKSIYHIFRSVEKVYHSGSGQIKEILAPVPSFDEWQDIKKYNRAAREIINTQASENTKLKELLKECQGSIATLQAKRITEVNGIKQKELLAKISQVLGEE